METERAFLEQPDVVEYWKSAPYFANFLDGYKLGAKVRTRLEEPGAGFASVAQVLAGLVRRMADSLAVYANRSDQVFLRALGPGQAGLGVEFGQLQGGDTGTGQFIVPRML